MSKQFRFPDVGEGITEGEIVRWLVKEGDEITVKVTDIDHLGRINLSRRAVFGDSSQDKTSRPTDSVSPGRSRPRPSNTRPGVRQNNSRDSRHRH